MGHDCASIAHLMQKKDFLGNFILKIFLYFCTLSYYEV